MTQATTSPKIALIVAAISAAPKLRRSAASTRGSVTAARKPAMPISTGRSTRAAKGISTITLR
jgi:hypothetical protein